MFSQKQVMIVFPLTFERGSELLEKNMVVISPACEITFNGFPILKYIRNEIANIYINL